MSKNVLITGGPGSGKTYLSQQLKQVGYNAIDADQVSGLAHWQTLDGQVVEFPPNADKDWLSKHHFIWDLNFLEKYLIHKSDVYFLGLSDNVFSSLDLFDYGFYLKADPHTIASRLQSTSRKNPLGKSKEHLSLILNYLDDMENKAKYYKLKIIDTSKPLEYIIQQITEDIH